MGSQESKAELTSENIQQKETDQTTTSFITESLPSTPILTPLDPRSPSANIARTPLELILGLKKNEDLSETVENVEEANTKELVNVLLGIDPRSPTVEFKRTPIIVGALTKDQPLRLQNKNFDNVLKSTIQTTPTTTTRKSNIVPPKLIGSTLITPLAATSALHNRKSFVGLLETNIDYTETDLDRVHQANDHANTSLPVVISEHSSISNKLKEQMDALHIDKQNDLNPVLEQPAQVEDFEETVKTPEPVQVLEDTNYCDYKSLEDKTINITEQVKDFDKKLTNLIYHDAEDEDQVILKFTKVKSHNRTPLGTRNSNEEPKKSASRLKVSDKPRKTDISKIPVFKEMKRNLVQCENTPPMKMEEKKLKTKVSHWDSDKTLII